ncbi:Hypothetical protein, putative [Bodo saltans]|uniref:Uncharacterized protein n=1 Tax=Bodo saltans TaxID=75058 RepID=A0A0S4J1F8_BODSA|nr:Hypothetical protein, putative [Bodo saltans]|eukprot:CUG31896.1 Hypothetical protein, putative [Bodo saltans]
MSSTFRDSRGTFFNTSQEDAALFGQPLQQQQPAVHLTSSSHDNHQIAMPPTPPTYQHTPSFTSWGGPPPVPPHITASSNGSIEPLSRSDILSSSQLVPLPNDLRDRERLMKHITYLASLVHRLQLEVEYYRHPAVVGQTTSQHQHQAEGGATPSSSFFHSQFGLTALAAEELQRRFDPIVAEAQLSRLDATLAQQSLLREADAMRIAALEREQDQLQQYAAQWKQRFEEVDEALQAAREWEGVATSRAEELRSCQAEVDRLRRTEQRLVSNLRKLKVHLGQQPASSSSDDDVESHAVAADDRLHHSSPSHAPLQTSPPLDQHHRYQRLFFDMDEAAARQDLLVEELCFGPLQYALHMAAAYDTEMQAFRTIGDDVMVDHHRSPSAEYHHRPSGGSHAAAPQHHPPPPAAGGSHTASHNTSTTSRHEEHQVALTIAQQVEALKQSNAFLDIQHKRMERLLEGERRRNEVLAADHCAQLEQIQHHLSTERKEYLERLAVEVRHAFREGMIREKANRRAKRAAAAAAGNNSTAAASVTSSNTSQQQGPTTTTL